MTRRDPRLALTAAAFVATALAALTCSPMLDDLGWWWPSLALIGVVAVTGALARAAGGPWFLVPFAQLGAGALFVTARFAPHDAIGGVVPTPAVGATLRATAERGFDDIDRLVIPVATTPGIALIAAVGIGLVALVVDVVAVGLRRPAPAGLALLAVYVVPAAVLADGLPWGWFALGGLGWLLLLAVGHSDAVEHWGATSGRGGAAPQAAAGAVAVVAVAALVAALAPGVSDGAFEGVENRRLDGVTIGGGATLPPEYDVTRLDVTLLLEQNLRHAGDTRVLSYVTSAGPQYLRLTVVEPEPGGGLWKPAQPPDDAPPVSVTTIPSGAAPPGHALTRVRPDGVVRYLQFMPTPDGTYSVRGLDGWSWDADRSTVFAPRSSAVAAEFDAVSTLPAPSAAELAGLDVAGGDDDLALPEGTPPELVELAEQVTEGATTPYERLVRLQRWFRTEFVYDVQAPAGDASSVLAAFLRDRRGYCQHFAATFTLMARSLGIPARTVLGFTPGRPVAGPLAGANDGSTLNEFLVSSENYHSWPEVHFAEIGWVRFEPTPRADGDLPGWAGDGGAPSSALPEPTQGSQPSAEPSAEPSAAPAPAPGTTTATSDDAAAGDLVPLLVAVVVLALVLTTPALLRALRRRRRLRVAADPARSPSDAVEPLWAELADTARDLGIPWAAHDSPRRSAAAFTEDAGLDVDGAAAVSVLTRDLEQVRYAPPSAVRVDEATRSRLRSALSTARASALAGRPRATRLRARLLPRSLAPRALGDETPKKDT